MPLASRETSERELVVLSSDAEGDTGRIRGDVFRLNLPTGDIRPAPLCCCRAEVYEKEAKSEDAEERGGARGVN